MTEETEPTDIPWVTENVDTTDLPWVRTSERSSFKRCPQQWYWGYIERLIPATTVIGAREFGTGIHLAMEAYYIPGLERGRPLLETWDEWCDAQDKTAIKGATEEDEAAWIDMRELGRGMLEVYDDVWEGDPNWEVISSEMHFEAVIEGKVIDVGTIDMVLRNVETGKIFILDHKTCGQFPNFAWLWLDDQCGSYSAFAQTILRQQGKIGPTEKVSGMIYNYLRKGKPDTRPTNARGESLNKDGSVSKVQPSPIVKRHLVTRTAKEKNRQTQRLIDDVSVMQKVRGGEIPVLKAPSRDCTWCDFFTLCQVDESKGDTESFKKRMFKERDPYADHRDGADSSKIWVGGS